ncbi:MAG: A24 family peptidase [Phycisphaerae bacterium]|nr:A24 family peptidase [Phycisphaerae bacterium]
MTPEIVIGLFTWLLGLCVGSFLNVVIYRLPAGLSVSRPAWSFCPSCQAGIRWYDNLPVLSWLLLRGRCRSCAAPISLQYPLVEAVTGLLFVLVFQLLFVAEARVGVDRPSLPGDLPLLLAWLTLAAALVACSGMDLIAYIVDTRVTDFALIVGVLAAACWPRPEHVVPSAGGAAGAAAVAAFAASALMLWLAAPHTPDAGDAQPCPPTPAGDSTTTTGAAQAGVSAADAPTGASDAAAAASRAAPPGRSGMAAGALATLALCGLAVVLLPATGQSAEPFAAANLPIHAALLALFFAIVLAGGHHRPADQELHAAIESEARSARRVILAEMLWLLPIVGAGALAALLVLWVPAVADAWAALANWRAGGLAPLGGAAYAMLGAMAAAGAGWVIRILFTLALGREAFATGDIFVLAAAGAAIGWDLALFGFLVSMPMAMVGWLLMLTLKRSGMIAFGPWLAIGFVTALWLDRAKTDTAARLAADVASAWESNPMALVLFGVVLIAGSVLAFAAARLVRGIVHPAPANAGE